MAEVFPVAQLPRALERGPRIGDYYCTEHELYRVEEVHGDFALVEDCRTEVVLEVAVDEILAMNLVRPAAGTS